MRGLLCGVVSGRTDALRALLRSERYDGSVSSRARIVVVGGWGAVRRRPRLCVARRGLRCISGLTGTGTLVLPGWRVGGPAETSRDPGFGACSYSCVDSLIAPGPGGLSHWSSRELARCLRCRVGVFNRIGCAVALSYDEKTHVQALDRSRWQELAPSQHQSNGKRDEQRCCAYA